MELKKRLGQVISGVIRTKMLYNSLIRDCLTIGDLTNPPLYCQKVAIELKEMAQPNIKNKWSEMRVYLSLARPAMFDNRLLLTQSLGLTPLPPIYPKDLQILFLH